MKKTRVLLVDDDLYILKSYQRQLRKEFDITIAQGGAQGLNAIRKEGPFMIVVADMGMPNMDGIAFLSRVKRLAPDTVRIMLTGYSDQKTAIKAINEGSIFRFLNKPCSMEILKKTLLDGMEQFRLIRAEKELLDKTLKGSVKILIDVLSLASPKAFGRASRLRRMAKQLMEFLEVEKAWQVEIAAMLSQIGCVGIPGETLDKLFQGDHLSEEEMGTFRVHPKIGSGLISNIPRLETVAEIILNQARPFNPSASSDEDEKENNGIALGASVLKLALDWDTLYVAGKTETEALKVISARKQKYDPRVLGALKNLLKAEYKYEKRMVCLQELRPAMILDEDVYSEQGPLLIAKGQEITPAMCSLLKNFRVMKPFQVKIPVKSPSTGQSNTGVNHAAQGAAGGRRA